jgi:hypothetical protein
MVGLFLIVICIFIPLVCTCWYNVQTKQVRQECTILATALAVGNVMSAYFLGILSDHNIATPSLGVHVPFLLLFYVFLIVQIVLNRYKQ